MKNSTFINDYINSIPMAALCIDKNRLIKAYNSKFSQLYCADNYPETNTPLEEIFFIASVNSGLSKKHQSLQSHLSENKEKIELSFLTHNNKSIAVTAQINDIDIDIDGLDQCRLLLIEPCNSLQDSHQRAILSHVIDKLDHGIFIAIFDDEGKGRHGQFIEVNEVSCQQLGYSRDELLQLNARSINPAGNIETIKAIGRNIKRDKKAEFNAIHVAKNGQHHSVHVTAKLINIDNKSYVLSICNYLDKSHQQADINQSRFGRLIELSWDEIYVFDIRTLRFSQANTGALDNLGYSKLEISQLRITDLLQDITEPMFHRLTESLFDAKKAQVVIQSVFKRKDNSEYPVEIRIQLSHSEVPPVYLANVQNITERKETEKNLLFLANHDPLTGLFNRNMFIDKLKESIKQCRRSDSLMAIIFLDLDGFKFINDTMGHDIGDELIIETSKQLLRSVRDTDCVARLGGDEFTVILSNLKHIDDVHCIAEKIVSNLSTPCVLKGHKIKTSCSLGITIYPFSDSDNAYSLIKQADTAMYQAKAQGKNTYSFYTATLAQQALNLRHLEDDLKRAFKNNEFEVYFQSKVKLDSRKIYGAEALLRWPNKKYPDMSAADFIPILEKTDFIKEVDLWVLRKTCENMSKWLQIAPDLVISINLSAKHFTNSQLVEDIKSILLSTKTSAKNLEIEITEGVLISKAEKADDMLNELKDIGFNISLDDFGSGYSSLSYLIQLPINCLKIDRAFVMDLDSNRDSQVIIKAIINMAKSLGLSVIAEGIEYDYQADILSALECKLGQGYLFSKPCPADHFFRQLQSDYK